MEGGQKCGTLFPSIKSSRHRALSTSRKILFPPGAAHEIRFVNAALPSYVYFLVNRVSMGSSSSNASNPFPG